MKRICKLCGNITQNDYICDDCSNDLKNKTFREFFKDENHLINFLIKDCLNCPIRDTNHCEMVYCNPQSIEEETSLCKEFILKWLNENHYI